MSRATLIYYRKRVYDDGAIVEMKLWRVPATVRGSNHSYKVQPFYGIPASAWHDAEPVVGGLFGGWTGVAGSRAKGQSMSDVKLIVGGNLEDNGAGFVDAWQRAERGETVDERALVFESWEALAKVLTGERYRLLKHVHAHPEPSVSALARSLGRQYRRVHADVAALEAAGLLARPEGVINTTADTLKADIHL